MTNFRKSKKFGGVRITASKGGLGISAGAGPLRVGRGANGKVRRTVRVPGIGISDTKVIGDKKSSKKSATPTGGQPPAVKPLSDSDMTKGLAFIIGAILLIILLVNFWRQILILCAIAIGAWIAFLIVRKMWRSRQAGLSVQAAKDERVAKRAEEQHRQYLQGEDAGIYGRFAPADLDKPNPRLRQMPRSPKEWRDENRK
ncbi:DUF4236 domain-containing protein [Rhodococcus sp. BH5]|uniref:DUF4236 domain-containing protein n=1 Tax=Rhodococcus sp. BH5 TaxID=2871702 RepID=UPI0022CD35D9|nr:DUF4236 domain-containing protein [Rhodococcus sp. BH5]MCZ9634597.1 DUF4236 domain-containing protein [Rhodococcus sp. BH5]